MSGASGETGEGSGGSDEGATDLDRPSLLAVLYRICRGFDATTPAHAGLVDALLEDKRSCRKFRQLLASMGRMSQPIDIQTIETVLLHSKYIDLREPTALYRPHRIARTLSSRSWDVDSWIFLAFVTQQRDKYHAKSTTTSLALCVELTRGYSSMLESFFRSGAHQIHPETAKLLTAHPALCDAVAIRMRPISKYATRSLYLSPSSLTGKALSVPEIDLLMRLLDYLNNIEPQRALAPEDEKLLHKCSGVKEMMRLLVDPLNPAAKIALLAQIETGFPRIYESFFPSDCKKLSVRLRDLFVSQLPVVGTVSTPISTPVSAVRPRRPLSSVVCSFLDASVEMTEISGDSKPDEDEPHQAPSAEGFGLL